MSLEFHFWTWFLKAKCKLGNSLGGDPLFLVLSAWKWEFVRKVEVIISVPDWFSISPDRDISELPRMSFSSASYYDTSSPSTNHKKVFSLFAFGFRLNSVLFPLWHRFSNTQSTALLNFIEFVAEYSQQGYRYTLNSCLTNVVLQFCEG